MQTSHFEIHGIGVFLLLVFLSGANTAKEEDKVIHVPHLIGEQPTFRHYAGYLNATEGRRLFYWFVESERDPANDPVVLWLNGGPGCSSLLGFLTEQGPWRVSSDGENLTWFEHRWNKIANILFLESPQCVGFSYAENGRCHTNDDQTAEDNYWALKDFFHHWSEYKCNPFYATGESYAGVYVPTLSVRIMNDPDFNFKGMAVGNGVTNRSLMMKSVPYYVWGRGLISPGHWESLVAECCRGENVSDCLFDGPHECRRQMRKVWDLYGSGINIYNYLAECDEPEEPSRMRAGYTVVTMYPESILPPDIQHKYFKKLQRQLKHMRGKVKLDIPCTDTSAIENFLSKPEVRETLHVPDSVQSWEACSYDAWTSYERRYIDMADHYRNITSQGHQAVVYFGDLDMVCDGIAGVMFAQNLGLKEVQDFKHWTYTDHTGDVQIAGYVIQYENFKFVSVKGAGHMVPTDKPGVAFDIFEKLLNQQDY